MIYALIALCILFLWGLAEAQIIWIKRRTLTLKGLPQKLRIAFLTDFHCSPFMGIATLRRLVKKINALQPDLILFGGDYIGDVKNPIPLTHQLGQTLSAFHAPCYGVRGNHDMKKKPQTLDILSSYGITFLINQSMTVKGLTLCGLDDMRHGRPDLLKALLSAPPGKVLLFMHNPDYLADIYNDKALLEMFSSRVALTLCGHTHGGQITFWGLFAFKNTSKWGNRFRTGFKKLSHVPIIISNGLGTNIVPLRFFAPPQVHIIDLNP